MKLYRLYFETKNFVKQQLQWFYLHITFFCSSVSGSHALQQINLVNVLASFLLIKTLE